MVIYLIKECSGVYEDYSEDIVYCTTDKNKAENKKLELEKQYKLELAQFEKCSQCCAVEFEEENYKQTMEELKCYCDNFELRTFRDDSYSCENEVYVCEESTFRIEEIECEE